MKLMLDPYVACPAQDALASRIQFKADSCHLILGRSGLLFLEGPQLFLSALHND